MAKPKKKTDLSQKVMEQIQKNQLKMRPRLYFVFGSLLLAAGLAGAIILAALFTHLAFFRLRMQGPFGYLWFGRFGLRPFLMTFPLLPFLVAVGGISGGSILLRRYDIAYKKSFAGLVIGLMILIVVSGFLLLQIRLNEKLGRFKPLHPLYQSRVAGRDWLIGQIVAVGEGEMVVVSPEGKETKVVWTEKTLFPFGRDFARGERVRVVGKWQGDVFMARGIGNGARSSRYPKRF